MSASCCICLCCISFTHTFSMPQVFCGTSDMTSNHNFEGYMKGDDSNTKLLAKVTDLESRSRRQNLRILGLAESEGGVLQSFLRVYCATFLEMTKDTLIREARRRGKLEYHGQQIRIVEDYCPEVLGQRVEYREPSKLKVKHRKVAEQHGDVYVVKTLSHLRDYSFCFRLNEEFEEFTKGLDERHCKSVVRWESNTLVCIQTGEKMNRGWAHWIQDDRLHLVTATVFVMPLVMQ
ncbi:uncharacterized protein [Paramormyrops kingsleyae]|uniref:uncharacterized protein n=1 Tax=Paramormyrops kingsleyae TaxID=1676925 RepID=UPI003B96F6FC